jgi:hypothetical protein
VALKKPSDFFGNNKKTPLDEVKESYESARPEKIEQVSEAFDAFKSNLNHLKSLSDFTSTFDSFKNNLEKVESVSSEVSEIKEEIKSLIKKEDLDSAMMAQLLFVEESISKIESKVSSINGKTVDKIREDFVNLSNSVESFLDVDVPKYKKLILESEVRFDDRLDIFKEQVEENLDSIKEDVSKEVTTALETVESVNENTINIVKAEFKETARDFNKNVNELVEKELPKYKKLFAETEVRTEEKVNKVIDTYRQNIEDLNAKVKLFTETEIPKYSNLLIETKLKSEQEVKDLEEEVLSKVNLLSEKVQSISEGIPEKTSEKIQELKDVTDQYKEEIDSIAKKYQSLYKDFKKREVSENEKLENYSQDIEKYHKRFNFLEETVTEDLREIQNVLVRSNENYHASLKTEVVKFRDKISKQMQDLEVDLVTNEKHIKKQNEHIESIQEEIKEVIERLQLDKLEEKNKELVEKINYLEETISEINEKKLLTEDNPTLPGDPSTNNSSDGLTPLDQKFATLDDLQNHYRLFINRIQQQIATIGGGGAGFIKDLDDVTFNESTGENQLLIYNGSKWVGIASTALGGGSGGDADSASKLVLDVRNNNIGYALTIGTPVYQTAYNSGLDRLDVEESRASNSTTMPAKGIVSSDLANNTSGQIIVYGELEGVNTQAYEVGDELYVAPGGGLTNVRPTDPTHLVQKIAVVLKKSTANGAILVYGAGRTNDVPNNISIAGSITAVDGFFSGNVTVGGTITYEDVKNVDSLGIVTARTGVDVLAGGINVTGVSTFNSDVSFDGDINGNVNIVSTDTGSAAAPELTLYRNSASPAPGDYLGQIMFKGENSNGGQENYAKITGKITDETLGTEDGLIETAIKGDGSFTIVSRQKSDELQLLNGVGLNVDGTSTFEDNVTINANISNTGTATFGSSTGIGTVSIGVGSTALLVEGDARVTGILTIGQGSITLDPNARKIEGIDEIIIGTATTVTIKQDTEGSIEFTDSSGQQKSVGIGTTVSINTTGIVTAATLKASTAFYPPIYTTSQRDAASFNEGAMIYNTTIKKMEFYDGTNWIVLPGMTLGLTVALDG